MRMIHDLRYMHNNVEVPTVGVTQESLLWLPLAAKELLPLWGKQIQPNPDTTHWQVSPTACKVMTPLNPDSRCHILASHSEQDLNKFFIEGIMEGF